MTHVLLEHLMIIYYRESDELVAAQVESLKEMGLVHEVTMDTGRMELQVTALGDAHVQQLVSLPLPKIEQRFIGYNGEVL